MSWEGAIEQAKIIAPSIADLYGVFVKEFEAKGFTRQESINLAIEAVKFSYGDKSNDEDKPW